MCSTLRAAPHYQTPAHEHTHTHTHTNTHTHTQGNASTSLFDCAPSLFCNHDGASPLSLPLSLPLCFPHSRARERGEERGEERVRGDLSSSALSTLPLSLSLSPYLYPFSCTLHRLLIPCCSVCPCTPLAHVPHLFPHKHLYPSVCVLRSLSPPPLPSLYASLPLLASLPLSLPPFQHLPPLARTGKKEPYIDKDKMSEKFPNGDFRPKVSTMFYLKIQNSLYF